MNNHTTAYDIIADLEGTLDKPTRRGDTLKARCPAHDDKTPSLSAKIGDNGDCVLIKCWGGCQTEDVVEALGWKMRNLFATDDAWRSNEAREIVDEARAASIEDAPPLPSDVPGRVQAWIASLDAADLDGKRRILYLIKDAPEWQQLAVDLRIAVVGAIKGRTEASMAVAILGRFDDRKLAWREPQGEVVDTSEPDVVSLATLLANPPELSTTVARGLAFGGTMGFIRGPKASGKTTVLAAAAARVSRGQPWAGHDTEAGTVLVVCNDDPRSWVLALRDFGADPERILTSRARVVSRPGKLAALLAEHKPTWVIIDNLRTWCRSMQLDTDNSSAAADAIDPLAEAIRECGYPVACTIVHNEARSKGLTSDPYAGRMRNSTVFEDAADWIVGCAHEDGSTMTTITAGEKTRRGIPTETLIVDLAADGHGTPTTGGGGGGVDPFTPSAPGAHVDGAIREYIMANPDGVSLRAIRQAVPGRASLVDARLKLVGERGPDRLWRLKEGVCPVADIGGGGHADTVCPVSVSDPLSHCPDTPGHGVSHVSQPIGDTVPGHGVRDTVSGHGVGEHRPVDLPLAGAKTTTPPITRGGLFTKDGSIDLSIPTPPGGEPAERGDPHDSGCPGGCGGSGVVNGKACDWGNYLEDRRQRRLRDVEPVVHTGDQPISVEQRIAIEQTFVSDLPVLLAHFDGPLPSSPAQLADVLARELLGAGETWPTLMQTAETIPSDMWKLATHAAVGLCNLHSEVTT